MPSEPRRGELRWRGIPAAPGVALGPAFVYRVARAEPPLRRLTSRAEVAGENTRFDEALAAVRKELHKLRDSAPGAVGSAVQKIFDAQLLILDDQSIHEEVRKLIADDQISAENAFARVVTKAENSITAAADPYLREMANEIETVKRRVINRLLGLADAPVQRLSRPSILLAHTITPTDIMGLRQDHLRGIVVETGGQTSHTALLAKSMGIPAVVGVRRDVRMIRPRTQLVVDGYAGVVIFEPNADTVEFIERKKKRVHAAWPKKLESLREQPATTRDGHTLALMANIDLAGEISLAMSAGAAGVGLYRTEYLFLQRGGYPSEARQRVVYRKAVESLAGKPFVVRTFDLGSDKVIPEGPPEDNPALGFRGLRISLARPKTLMAQYRALLAASALGPVWVMVPMVSSLEEFAAAKRAWRKAQSELTQKGVPFAPDAKLGLMIETPAAVFLAEELAEEADFFSIGTNDLIQYTVSVDRGNVRVAHLNHHWHPALWRQLGVVANAAREAGIPVGVCGEMAGDPLAVAGLIGLGMSSVSCHPNSIPRLKSLIRSMSYSESRDLAAEVLTTKTAVAIQQTLKEFNRHVSGEAAQRQHG